MSVPFHAPMPSASQLGERPYRIAAVIAALLILFTTAV